MSYRHPREIENFDKLATDSEPTVKRTSSDIALLEDGDGPRNWRLEKRWGLLTEKLVFTILDRPSPSAMARQCDVELRFVPSGKEGGWWMVDGFEKYEMSKEAIDGLIPSKFSGWVAEQEDPPPFSF